MRLVSIGVLLCVLALTATARVPWYDRIKRIVVLMEENRSYDHLMGWNNKSKTHLTGTEFNYINCTNHSAGKLFASPDAPYLNDCDPNHGYPATTYKIFGPEAAKANNLTDPTMEGFVEWEHGVDGWTAPADRACNVMDGFAPDRLPVWTSLVDEFVAFDRFFCSVPGPTWPNRLFFLGATSLGLTETIPWYKDQVGQLFPMRTIFDQISDTEMGEWKYYFHDTPWELFVESLAHSPERMFDMDTFYRDAEEGTLPHFSFINPRAGVNMTTGHGSNDMHPDHDVALAETLYKRVYEAVRASPQWNETLLIVTFDEHGGFWDSVTPPQPVPPPGNYEHGSYPDNFTFNRGGIRIPTVLISPWLPKGVMQSDPPAAQMPDPTSRYELTSIMATVRKLLPFMNETGPLTARDAWAATFEHLFDVLDEPRTDCPMHLPDAPPAAALPADMKEEHERPVNGLQTFIMSVNAHLAGVEYPAHITKQGAVAEWANTHFHHHREKTLAWKRSKPTHPETTSNITARIVPDMIKVPDAVTCTWEVRRNFTRVPFDTITLNAYNKTFCLDVPSATPRAGDVVGLSLCYPTADPWNNRDITQQWYYTADYKMHPKADPGLCITTRWMQTGQNTLRLEECGAAPVVTQSFSYQGTAPGMAGGDGPNVGTHHIYHGDEFTLFCAMPLTFPTAM
jgi:phospholipase C